MATNGMSYATNRKLKIIEKEVGVDWQEKHPGKSIDAVYNIVTGDQRKNLFCKIDPDVKRKLDEMVDFHDIRMAELVEKLVQQEYDRFLVSREATVEEMASQFAVG